MTGTCIALAALVLASMAITCRAAEGPLDSGREKRLRASVEALAGRIGERHTRKPESLKQAEEWVSEQLGKSGLNVVREEYDADGQTVANLYVDLKGTSQPETWIVVGAHYDSVRDCPAANDNGSGVAALIELAVAIAKSPREKSIRFVAFVNEEPPFFQTGLMGSVVHASGCRKRGEQVEAMISLETIGYFSDEPNSQQFPPGLQERYPTIGNFIAVVGNPQSAGLAKQVHEVFSRLNHLPAEIAVLPAGIAGVGWSDHWSFWQQGYPAIMLTDTAPFRYPHYHQPTDTPDKIDYARMADVVDGVEKAIEGLAVGGPTTHKSP